MTESKNSSSLDLLGIKPIGDAANMAVDKSFQGIEGFLKSICVPALDEIGFLIRDKVRHWRLNNILRILEKAKGKLEFENEQLQIQAHPRVALAIIDNGSLNDNDEVQEMWAGLFASSCTKSGQNDENLIFVDILKQLTVAEVRMINYTCVNARKILFENGLIVGDELNVDCKSLLEISGISEIHRLDRELDHLRSLELFSGGFNADDKDLIANISPTSLGLNLYVRAQGHNTDPIHYWKGNIVTEAEREKERKENEIAQAELNRQKKEQLQSNNNVKN